MHRMLTLILACLVMVGALAIDIFLPSMPAIGREFAVGPLAVQQTLSLFLFTFALMTLFYSANWFMAYHAYPFAGLTPTWSLSRRPPRST